MTYYNTLVAEKLKIISEIQRTNSLIDSHKKEGKDFSAYLEQLVVLKTELEVLNAQILSFHLNQGTLDSSVQGPSIALETPAQNGITDNLDDSNSYYLDN